MTLVVTHTTVTGAAASPEAIVGGPDWDANHTLTGTVDASQLNTSVVQAVVNDTNITGAIAAQVLTFLWSGLLGLARGGTNADLSATGGTGQYLKQASAGAAVTVGTIPASDIASGAALTKTDDTNVTLTLGGTPATSLLKATSLTLGWTGTLAVARGGTGTGTATGTAGSVVLSGGSPAFTGTPVLAAPSATTLIVGSSTTLPSPAVGVFTANTTTLPNPPTGTVLQISAADGAATGAVIDSFASSPTLTFRRADTSAAAPSAVQSGEVIMSFGAIGYATAGYSASQRLQIVGKATENWTGTAQGTSIQFNIVTNTTTTVTLAMLIQNTGGVSIGTSTATGIGSLLANTSILSQGATAGIGYATGAGGAVTQATNRTTGVTLNTVTGAITLFSQVNTAVSLATAQTFTLTNSAIAAADVVHVTQKSGTDKYLIFVTNTAAGSCQITNFTTGGTTNEAPVFSFAVIKGVTS